MPVTVEQLSEAHRSDDDDESGFSVDGVDVTNVSEKTVRVTDVSFSLDDGTGRVECRRWVNVAADSREMEEVYWWRRKDLGRAIVFFSRKAIIVGDRADGTLKDMAIVMKQQDPAEDAIKAIRSFRDRCSDQAQESLDNALIDLCKKGSRLEEQVELL